MILKASTLASVSLIVLGHALAPQVAQAQEAEPDFGEIIVTAQKRAQSVQDVPVSIDVVDQSLFENRQIDTLSELALAVPGFEFARSPSDSPGVTFRGIGTQAGNVSFDNSIGMFVDGAFLGNVRLYGQTLFDLERVELIKGTQSTLLGKNTSLGAISVVNKRPVFRTAAALEIGAEVENGGYFGDGYVNLPLSDTFALRVSGSYSNLDGWVRNVTTENEVPQDTDIGLRTSLLYEDRDSSLSVLLTYQYTENERWGTANQITDPGLSALGLGVGPDLGESNFDGIKASFSSDPRLKDGEDITRLEAHMATATIEYDLGSLALTSITSGAWFDHINNLDFDFDNKDFNVFARSEDYSQFLQELRLASPGGEDLEYLVGLFYFTSKWSLLQDNVWGIPDFPPGAPVEGQIFNGSYIGDFRQRTNAISAYAQASYQLSEVLRVNAGLRYTNERKKVNFGRTNRAPFTLWNSVIQAPFPYQRLDTVEDNLLSGSISLQYDVNDDVMLYAGFGRGGKAGGYGEFNSIPIDPALGTGNPQRDAFIGNERANSYEVGVKAILADSVRVNAAFFYMDVFGLQQLVFTGEFTSSNDRARSVGAEGSIIWQATDTLSFSTAGTYADAKVTDLDQRLAQSPRFSGSLRADWEDNLTSDLLLNLGAGVRHRSSKFNQLGEGLPTPSYTTLALNARMSSESSRWFINLAAENVTNETGADFGFVGPDPFVATFETLAPLRSIKISAGIEF
jgi:iron complex outermembrane receptor protein